MSLLDIVEVAFLWTLAAAMFVGVCFVIYRIAMEWWR